MHLRHCFAWRRKKPATRGRQPQQLEHSLDRLKTALAIPATKYLTKYYRSDRTGSLGLGVAAATSDTSSPNQDLAAVVESPVSPERNRSSLLESMSN